MIIKKHMILKKYKIMKYAWLWVEFEQYQTEYYNLE